METPKSLQHRLVNFDALPRGRFRYDGKEDPLNSPWEGRSKQSKWEFEVSAMILLREIRVKPACQLLGECYFGLWRVLFDYVSAAYVRLKFENVV